MRTLVLFILIFTVLIGCEESSNVSEIPEGKDRFNGINSRTISIIVDSKTGCKYIYAENGQGNNRTTAMSPLYKSSGVVDCE